GDLHRLDAGRHLLGAELYGLARTGGEDAAAHRPSLGHEPELVGLARGRGLYVVEAEIPVLVVGGDEEHAPGRRLKGTAGRRTHGARLNGGRGDQRELVPHAQRVRLGLARLLDGARGSAALQIELLA